MSRSGLKAYANATQTVAPTRQVVMLYDAVLKSLKQAKVALEAGNIEARFHALKKAGEIVFGLQNALDFDSGGEVAQTLYQFYAMVDGRIIHLHRYATPESMDAVIADVKSMRDAWAEIDTGAASGEIAAPPLPTEQDLQAGLQSVSLSA